METINLILLTLLSGAVLTDLYKDKIYNFWVIPGLLAGITSAAFGGIESLQTSICAIGISLGILLPVYLFKGIAAGDIKLFMSAASFLTVQETVSCILLSFLIAGVISLGVLITGKNLKSTIHFAVPILISFLFLAGGTT